MHECDYSRRHGASKARGRLSDGNEDEIPTDSLTIERLSPAALRELRADWNALAGRTVSPTPFLRWELIHGAWTRLEPSAEPLFLAFRDGRDLVGLAPLVIRRSGGLRRVGFVGDALFDCLDVLCAPGHEHAVGAAVWRALADAAQEWDAAAFLNVRDESPLFAVDGPPMDAWKRSERIENLCRVVRIGGDFEAYAEARPGLKYRRTFVKKVRKLMQTEQARLVVPDRSGLDAFMTDFLSLHRRRSAETARRSLLTDAAVGDLLRETAGALFDDGVLRPIGIQVHGRMAACYVAFRVAERLFLYQSGLDPDFRHLSAGAVLTSLVIRSAFEEPIEEVDFLTGEEPYKDIWATDRRRQRSILLYRRTLKGRLARASDSARHAGKMMARAASEQRWLRPLVRLVQRLVVGRRDS